jgi:hypothetical protein
VTTLTLEQLIEQAKKLPAAEQRRLRLELENLDEHLLRQAGSVDTAKERKWIAEHRQEYIGEWVALDGDQMIAHGSNAREVYLAALQAGFDSPYMDRVEKLDEPFVGGWL